MEAFYEDLLPFLNSKNVTNFSDHDMDNLLFVKLQPLSLDVTSVEHVPELTLLDIFAQIGGFMGLFLGASLMTWLELFDVILLVVGTCLSSAFRRV